MTLEDAIADLSDEVEKTGIYQEVVDFDEMFRSLTFAPIIANDYDISTPEGKEALNDLIYTRYDGDALNMTPTCGCHTLEGGSVLHSICPVCNEACEVPTDKPLVAILWMAVPVGIKAFMNPAMWIMLGKKLTTSKFNVLEWLCDANYAPDFRHPPELQRLEDGLISAGIPRGLNSFYDNFDTIMQLVYELRVILPIMRREIEPLIRENRDKIFCQHLPIPSKVSFVIESSRDTNYYDKNIPLAVDALRTIVSIEQGVRPVKGARRESKVVNAISKLSEYYYGYFSDIFGGKYGLSRQHIVGSRVGFTARAVITSIIGPSNHDDLHTPWALSLQLFKLHITNKLWGAPYYLSPIQIDKLLKESAYTFNQTIYDVMQSLIAESPLGRIPVVFQRNPTLRPGSGQLLYICLIKKDPSDTTISLSNNVLNAATADLT